MPAVTLGLAEVTERLRGLRRRLNTFVVLQALCVSLSAACLACALLVILGLRASANTFRVATWAGLLYGAAALVGAVLFVRRRWLDEAETAHVADRRAQLTDRLTTLFDLGVRPRPSRLAPVLLAQTLALGTRWQAQQIAPRRVPWSVLLLIASILTLGAAPLVAPEPPVEPQSTTGTSAVAPTHFQLVPEQVEPLGTRPLDGPHAAGTDDAGELAHVPPSRADGAASGAEISPDTPAGIPAGRTGLAAVPDRLQEAIRRTFHVQAVDQPRELAARVQQKDSGDREEGERMGSEGGRHEGSRKPHDGAPGSQPVDRLPPNVNGSRNQAGQPDPANPHPDMDGVAPAAGEGSSPNGLMASAQDGDALGQEATKTFKLTITSFLRTVEQHENQQRPAGPRSATTGDATRVANAPPALSDQQLRDDTLRKAEIPVEYEDIVRRVYSLRGEP